MSRDILPLRLGAGRFLSRHASPTVWTRTLDHWGFALGCCPLRLRVLNRETVFPIPVVPCYCVTALLDSLKLISVTGCKVGNQGPIGDSWPIAFLGYPREHRVSVETPVQRRTGPNSPRDTCPRTRTSQEPDWPATRLIPGDGTDSLPETLTPLAVSVLQRRNVLLSSRRSK